MWHCWESFLDTHLLCGRTRLFWPIAMLVLPRPASEQTAIHVLPGECVHSRRVHQKVHADKLPTLNRIARFSKTQLQISLRPLTASALFAKVQLQISLRPLTASALFAKVQLQISLRPLTASHVFQKCQFGASKVSIRWAQISKKSLTASALFEKVQLQISSRTLTASALLSGTFYLFRNL